jgi:hypothetical protein
MYMTNKERDNRSLFCPLGEKSDMKRQTNYLNFGGDGNESAINDNLGKN